MPPKKKQKVSKGKWDDWSRDKLIARIEYLEEERATLLAGAHLAGRTSEIPISHFVQPGNLSNERWAAQHIAKYGKDTLTATATRKKGKVLCFIVC